MPEFPAAPCNPLDATLVGRPRPNKPAKAGKKTKPVKIIRLIIMVINDDLSSLMVYTNRSETPGVNLELRRVAATP